MSDFTITDRAAEHILSEAKEKGKSPVLRVGIKGGGCTGYTYVFEWLSGSASEKDLVFENNGAKVVIDPKSMIYLSGSELGYKSTLMERGFKLENPNTKGSCGCGIAVSF